MSILQASPLKTQPRHPDSAPNLDDSLARFRDQIKRLRLIDLHEFQDALVVVWSYYERIGADIAQLIGCHEDEVWDEIQDRPEFQRAVAITARRMRERRAS